VLRVLRGLYLPLALCSNGQGALLHCIIMQCLGHVTIARPVAEHCTRRRVVPLVSFLSGARFSPIHNLRHALLGASALRAASLVFAELRGLS
jgi:hypothetical protein